MPDELPAQMYGQVTAFIGGMLVIFAGGTLELDDDDDDDEHDARSAGFSWHEQLRLWHPLPRIPTAVIHPAYCVLGSRLFAVGGFVDFRSDPDAYEPGENAHYTTRLQIYDSATRRWSLGPPLTAPKERREVPLRAVAYKNRVYVFATHEGPDKSRHCYVYSPQAAAWSELPRLAPENISELGACVHDGRLVVAGITIRFELPKQPRFTFMYELDDTTQTWTAPAQQNDRFDNSEKMWQRAKEGEDMHLWSFPLRLRSR